MARPVVPSITEAKISFVTPLSKALMHKKVGEEAILNLGKEKNIFQILKIEYGE